MYNKLEASIYIELLLFIGLFIKSLLEVNIILATPKFREISKYLLLVPRAFNSSNRGTKLVIKGLHLYRVFIISLRSSLVVLYYILLIYLSNIVFY